MLKTFIHIGLHKTGTTAIQTLLYANRGRLAKQGYVYPETGMQQRGHHKLAWALHRKPELRGLWSELLDEISQRKLPRIILSSEEFEFLRGPRRWKELRSLLPTDLRIVCYLRRQDDFLLSAYSQHVKGGGYETLESFMARISGRLDYLKFLEGIEKAVGRDNIIVRVYEDEQLPRGLFHDFLEAIEVEPATFRIPAGRANPRLSEDALRIMLEINPLIEDSAVRKRIAKIVQSGLSGCTGSSPPLLDAAARMNLIAQFAESNMEVARRYLGRADGTLFMKMPDQSALPA